MKDNRQAGEHHGMNYTQNYDVVTKWMAETLRGETLEVLGIQSGRIAEVFGFEPVDIKVTAERVDLMLRDVNGSLFHLEEQRNLQKTDLYRFASYHFLAAKQWGDEVTSIILVSGDVMAGKKEIETKSGVYRPTVIDFTQRDGEQRLQEIRKAVQNGTFDGWMELVFVPLYGKDTDMARSVLVEDVMRFEIELYHAGMLSQQLLAVTLIMSNKLIAKDRLLALWEEIKMLDILEIAEEKGIEKGIEQGIEQGKALGMVATMQDIIIDTLMETCGVVVNSVVLQVRALSDPEVLKGLHRKAIKCHEISEFEALLQQFR